MKKYDRSSLLSGLHLTMLLLLCFSAQAQLFQPPQPLMFDRGYDQYSPPAGTRRMVLSRYIPGARFPKDFDVVVETLEYDRGGHLIQNKRFQNITGDPTMETNYTWTAEGNLLQERITIPSDRSEIIRNYVWEKDANGKLTKAVINDKTGKPIANVEILLDGSMAITENSLGGKFVRSTFNQERRLLKSENSATGQTEAYSYYPDGTVKELNITSPKGVAVVKYENKLDDKGRVIQQTEIGKTSPRTYFFSYDSRGNMIDRGTIPNQPTESRGHDVKGRLTDILTFEAAGQSKEVLNISYETW